MFPELKSWLCTCFYTPRAKWSLHIKQKWYKSRNIKKVVILIKKVKILVLLPFITLEKDR